MEDSPKTKEMITIAAYASVIAAGSFISIPIGPVPITLQTMAVALAGMFLGSKCGAYAVLLYIFAGIAGVPVFAGGKAGFAILFGPTGGYLMGFIASAALCGLVSSGYPQWKNIVFVLIAFLVMHLTGIIGIWLSLGRTLPQAAMMDAIFIPGDMVKASAAFFVWRLISCRNKG